MRWCACLVIACAMSVAVAGENWPEFRGPTDDGHSDATGLPLTWSETENVVWKTPLHGRGWSSPVVWGDQVWLTTATEDGLKMSAICVDRESGEIIHDILLFENEEASEIHELNSYASPTPVIEEGRVYITFGSYGTACLDTGSGDTLWARRDLKCEHYRGPGSSPILFENLLITHYDGFDFQYVIALDKETGDTVWRTERDVEYGTDNGDHMKAYNTPIIVEVGGRPQLISPTSKASLAYDPYTGKELWRIRYNEFSTTSRSVAGHGLVFINSGFGKAVLYAVRPTGEGDVTDTHVEWKEIKSIPNKPSPLLIGDLLYVVHDAGVATCFEAKTGEVVWQDRLGGNYSGSPVYADGRIYIFSHEGTTIVLEPGREFKVLATNQLDDGFMSSPAIAGKALYVRTRTHLYRLEQSR